MDFLNFVEVNPLCVMRRKILSKIDLEEWLGKRKTKKYLLLNAHDNEWGF